MSRDPTLTGSGLPLRRMRGRRTPEDFAFAPCIVVMYQFEGMAIGLAALSLGSPLLPLSYAAPKCKSDGYLFGQKNGAVAMITHDGQGARLPRQIPPPYNGRSLRKRKNGRRISIESHHKHLWADLQMQPRHHRGEIGSTCIFQLAS